MSRKQDKHRPSSTEDLAKSEAPEPTESGASDEVETSGVNETEGVADADANGAASDAERDAEERRASTARTSTEGRRKKKKRAAVEATTEPEPSRASVAGKRAGVPSKAVLEVNGARRLFATSALLLLAGIALSAIDQAALGSWIAVAGLVGAIWGTHRLGRVGVDGETA